MTGHTLQPELGAVEEDGLGCAGAENCPREGVYRVSLPGRIGIGSPLCPFHLREWYDTRDVAKNYDEHPKVEPVSRYLPDPTHVNQELADLPPKRHTNAGVQGRLGLDSLGFGHYHVATAGTSKVVLVTGRLEVHRVLELPPYVGPAEYREHIADVHGWDDVDPAFEAADGWIDLLPSNVSESGRSHNDTSDARADP